MKVEIRCGKFVGQHHRNGYKLCRRLLATVEAHDDGTWTTETKGDLSGMFDDYPDSAQYAKRLEYPEPICPSHGDLSGVDMIAIQFGSWRGDQMSPYLVDAVVGVEKKKPTRYVNPSY